MLILFEVFIATSFEIAQMGNCCSWGQIQDGSEITFLLVFAESLPYCIMAPGLYGSVPHQSSLTPWIIQHLESYDIAGLSPWC